MAILAVALTGVAMVSSPRLPAADQDPTAALKAKLRGSQYKDVQASVDQNGMATLSGTVPLYENKEDADQIAHKVKGVEAVRNDIEVAGNVPDATIIDKLAPQLAYSRQGFGNVFDAILLQVKNGVVTLSGSTHNYPNRDAAVGIASTTPGVKEVIDNIQVDPVSPMDDRIRMEVARAIYSFPALQRYAINPAQPIRIAVQNGNVALYGMVANSQDRQLAYMRARQVPGIFSVKNLIEVEGQPASQQPGESPQK